MEELLNRASIIEVKKGTVLLKPEDIVNKVFYLRNGYVRMYTITKTGIETTIHIFKPTSYFPMISILAETKNKYFFESVNQVSIYLISKKKLVGFLRENPEELQALTTRLLKGLDKLTKRIELLANANARTKTLSAIVYLARHFGQEDGKEISIQESFTHQDIASLAGLTRETTSREWKKLEREKIVSYKNKKIYIKKQMYESFLD